MAPPAPVLKVILSLLALPILGFTPADLNDDGHVDHLDVEVMLNCRTGPSVPVTDPACLVADLDGDGDVDQDDFALLQQCYSGIHMLPVHPGCLGELVSISGRVQFANGVGVPGVVLFVTNSSGYPIETVETPADGTYTLTVHAGWSGLVSAYHDSYLLSPTQSGYDNLTQPITDRTVIAEDSSGGGSVVVSGQIRNRSGDTIAGCVVQFTGSGASSGTNFTTITGSTGQYSQNLPEGWSGNATSDSTWRLDPASVYTNLVQSTTTNYTAFRNYYVSPSGNDTAPGSLSQPFRTPQKAADIVNPGETVYVRGGTYTAAGTASTLAVMRVIRSGTADAPITFTAYPGETVIFNGEDTRWEVLALGVRASDQQYSSGQGVEHIIIEGFIVEGATRTGLSINGPANLDPPTAHIAIRRCIARDNIGGGIGTRGKMNNVLIEYCEAYQNLQGGIGFGRMSKNFHVDEPEDDMNAASYSTIRHCLAYNNEHPDTPGNTDGMGGSHTYRCAWEDNVVFGNSDDGIDIYASLEATVSRNLVFNHHHPEGNGAGIKVSAGGGGGHLLLRNVSFDNKSYGLEASSPSLPLLTYRASTFHNNLVYRTGSPALSIGGGTAEGTWVVHNNIAVEATGSIDYRIWSPNTISDYNFMRETNLAQAQSAGYDLNSRSGDPGFLNPGTQIDTNFGPGWTIEQKLEHIRSQVAARFGLKSTSQCVNTGMILGYPFNGSAPDIGAYESPW